ncbi:carboxylesterase/lipase family protein [Microbacterium hatanonis]
MTGGFVRGVREGDSIAWRGIPYADAPIGPLRFRSPRPVRPWAGMRDASTFGPVATQLQNGQFAGVAPGIPQGEDCLTINVVSPAEPTVRRMPVMVFIHGGGYSAGSSRDFSGEGRSFVRTGEVLYVSFSYRLGALGYLDFSRYSSRYRRIDSNLGLRDQVAALRWVHRNIAAFGGDPGNVTVFGESAGGNAITTLMTIPSAGGLFARAIAQSSPANAAYDRALAAAWAADFVDALRRSEHDERPRPLTTEETVALLTTTTATALVTAALAVQACTPQSYPGTFCFAPVIDGRLLPQHPLHAFRTGHAHRVPLIIGTNDREGSVFRGRIDILPRSTSRVEALFAAAPSAARAGMGDAYPGLRSGRSTADFAGDYAFWYPSVKVADYHSRFARVHSYRFDVAPRLLRWAGLDATHGLEMYALFDQADAPFARMITAFGGRKPFTDAGDRMRDAWLHFATRGTAPDVWPPYDEVTRFTRIFAESDRVEGDPRSNRRAAWEAFLPLI